MIMLRSRSGLLTGMALVAGLAGCAVAPPPVSRTVATEQVTTTTRPPPQVITTTREDVALPDHYGNGRFAATHRRWSQDGDDLSEDTTETGTTTIVPAQPQTTIRTSTIRSMTGN
jgi:hypothetical protein